MEIDRELTLEGFLDRIGEYGEYIQQFKKRSIERMNCIIYILRYTNTHRHLWEHHQQQKAFVIGFARHYREYNRYANKIPNFDYCHVETIYMLCDQIIDPEHVIG
jgi:hypothetical protein